MRTSTKRDEALIGDDGELVIPEQFSDAAISLRVALPDLYLVDPAHEIFFRDDQLYRRRPTCWRRIKSLQTSCTLIFIYGLFIAILISMVLAGQLTQVLTALSLIGASFALTLIIVRIIVWIVVRFTTSKEDLLRQRGKLIKGYISTFEHIGDYDEIDYQFLTPDGRKFTSHERVYRNLRTSGFNAENQDKFIPEEGTPVAVLYLNDKIFKLL